MKTIYNKQVEKINYFGTQYIADCNDTEFEDFYRGQLFKHYLIALQEIVKLILHII